MPCLFYSFIPLTLVSYRVKRDVSVACYLLGVSWKWTLSLFCALGRLDSWPRFAVKTNPGFGRSDPESSFICGHMFYRALCACRAFTFPHALAYLRVHIHIYQMFSHGF